MGNNCVSRLDFFGCRSPNQAVADSSKLDVKNKSSASKNAEGYADVQVKAPEVVKIGGKLNRQESRSVRQGSRLGRQDSRLGRLESTLLRQESRLRRQESQFVRQESRLSRQESRVLNNPKPSAHVRRVSSAGLQVESVLNRKTGNLKDYYTLGRKLGHGQFGTTFLCIEKAAGKEYACKSIAKRKLVNKEDVEDVRREIEIMHHLKGHPNVITIKDAYEDAVAVHVVMELCVGGELFDRIVRRGHYTERKAADLARTIVGVVEACHSLGVMHRDLKPENFLFVNEDEESPLKTIDFGLSIFFKPGMILETLI